MQKTIRNDFLIETQELEDLISNGADIQIVNASWYPPSTCKSALDDHIVNRITADT